jgi:hypothetical protein
MDNEDDGESLSYHTWRWDVLPLWKDFRNKRKHSAENWKHNRASLMLKHDWQIAWLTQEANRKETEAYNRGRDDEAHALAVKELQSTKQAVFTEIQERLVHGSRQMAATIEKDARKLLDSIYGQQYLEVNDIHKDVKHAIDSVYDKNMADAETYVEVNRIGDTAVQIRATLQLTPQSISVVSYLPYHGIKRPE